ncbi:hypothetical protein L484_016605 [Morus notabilis]|uniref:Uncharacterized protein n=1 Tax=Morus notabilis TaxID=981085 RepID=W9QW06_9ROSA|nr:hypothetical protein L484_016605 [Morus notabilis]
MVCYVDVWVEKRSLRRRQDRWGEHGGTTAMDGFGLAAAREEDGLDGSKETGSTELLHNDGDEAGLGRISPIWVCHFGLRLEASRQGGGNEARSTEGDEEGLGSIEGGEKGLGGCAKSLGSMKANIYRGSSIDKG